MARHYRLRPIDRNTLWGSDQTGHSCRFLNRGTVEVHALSGGHFTLPEHQFVHPVSRDARKSVPSLCFLIRHEHPITGKETNIIFDLGLRRDVMQYSAPIQKHIETRQPLTTDPDIIQSLAKGGLQPSDIDYVIYSHVHWDHVGEPRDFPTSTFIVGHGTTDLFSGSSHALRGSHSFFEPDLLPKNRTIELSDPSGSPKSPSSAETHTPDFNNPWEANDRFPSFNTLDVFGDESLLIVDAPGHLTGHINLLAVLASHEEVYLAGDACHDKRLLTGEKSIGEWNDEHGQTCWIHENREQAEETIERIKMMDESGIEIILAHDVEWENDPENELRFFGAEES